MVKGVRMEEIKEKVKTVRGLISQLNTLTKELEGEGCDIKYHCSEPYNKIDFVNISLTFDFKEVV